jgi:ABC-type bacteriocin/lantibiotic exporter with double-glycine peptidase domain
MLEILNTPHEVKDYSNKKLKILSGQINFENVKFSYED